MYIYIYTHTYIYIEGERVCIYIYIYIYSIYQNSLFFNLARILTNSQNRNKLFQPTNSLFVWIK